MNRRTWPLSCPEMRAFVDEMRARGDACDWDGCELPTCYGPCCFPSDYATMHSSPCHRHAQRMMGYEDDDRDCKHEYACRKCGEPRRLRKTTRQAEPGANA